MDNSGSWLHPTGSQANCVQMSRETHSGLLMLESYGVCCVLFLCKVDKKCSLQRLDGFSRQYLSDSAEDQIFNAVLSVMYDIDCLAGAIYMQLKRVMHRCERSS